MKFGKIPKIDPLYSRGWKGNKHLKKQVSRQRRRQEKQFPEDAGTKLSHFTYGWNT